MNSSLKPEGVFILFGIFSMLAVSLEWHFVAETKNLSECDKKNIYMPGELYGRKLKPGERKIEKPLPKTPSVFNDASSERSITMNFGNASSFRSPYNSVYNQSFRGGNSIG